MPDRLEGRDVDRDGEQQPQVRCPRCGEWADVDDDQLAGAVSLICSCGWHGWIDGRTA